MKLTEQKTASYLSVPVPYLRQKRNKGLGPSYEFKDGNIFYDTEVIDKWKEENNYNFLHDMYSVVLKFDSDINTKLSYWINNSVLTDGGIKFSIKNNQINMNIKASSIYKTIHYINNNGVLI